MYKDLAFWPRAMSHEGQRHKHNFNDKPIFLHSPLKKGWYLFFEWGLAHDFSAALVCHSTDQLEEWHHTSFWNSQQLTCCQAKLDTGFVALQIMHPNWSPPCQDICFFLTQMAFFFCTVQYSQHLALAKALP